MIPLNDIKNGSQFVETPAGAAGVIHQLSSFTPVVRDNATYPNADHVFYPNGILPDGADRPVPGALRESVVCPGPLLVADLPHVVERALARMCAATEDA